MTRMMARMIAKKQDDGQDDSQEIARAREHSIILVLMYRPNHKRELNHLGAWLCQKRQELRWFECVLSELTQIGL